MVLVAGWPVNTFTPLSSAHPRAPFALCAMATATDPLTAAQASVSTPVVAHSFCVYQTWFSTLVSLLPCINRRAALLFLASVTLFVTGGTSSWWTPCGLIHREVLRCQCLLSGLLWRVLLTTG
jgi:hypothetical protein